MSHRICLCPASIAWIRKHLQKSAKKTFTNLLKKGSISNITKRSKRKSRRTKRRGKPAWMIKGSTAAKRHMRMVRSAR